MSMRKTYCSKQRNDPYKWAEIAEKKLEKIRASTGFEPVPQKHYLGVTNNWATKLHVRDKPNLGRFFALAKEFDHN